MTKTLKSPSRLITLFCTTAFVAIMPLSLHVNVKTGALDVVSSVAFADNDGGNDSGSDDHGSDDNGSDDHGSAGHGSDDNGSDDNGSDDNGSDDHGSDDNGSDDNGTDDNMDGLDDSTGTSVSGSTSGSGATAVSVINLRRFANGIEVELSDGSVESIIDGTYTRRSASGAVVENHAATRANIDRLSGL
ncbi:hypothetical protein [Rhodobacter ferrooxidans]|uniref:Uncharacterized protein n=1 Tax=Rhodobacter ferrooxidans TaxID=371731 RepID=C8RXJ7_9RHOB|nr:hypothetical protein [Rhodobacter sp. SW2]EEW26722.1 hypothetical protein Rsw2DRAFT_0525 [Rhodobacter sp. SW2]